MLLAVLLIFAAHTVISLQFVFQVTGLAPAHFPILATLLGNDYLAFDYFKDFYDILEAENKNKRSRMTTRHNTIKNVLTWLSRQKGKTTEKIISSVSKYDFNISINFKYIK